MGHVSSQLRGLPVTTRDARESVHASLAGMSQAGLRYVFSAP